MKKYKITRFSGYEPTASIVEAMDIYDLVNNKLGGNYWDVIKIELVLDAEAT
jgi:hypothetical protein